MCEEIKKYYELNDLIPEPNGDIRIAKKATPKLIGWGCDCGFMTTKKEEIEKHYNIALKKL